MKLFFVLILLAFVTWTFVHFVNSFPSQYKTFNTNSNTILRKGHRRTKHLWPNSEIPYEIISDFLPDEMCQIERAMYHIMWNSCIRFRIKSQNDTHWVRFANYTHCVSSIGFNPELNDGIVTLASGCFDMETIVQEIVHSIGYWQESSFNEKELIKLALSNSLQREDFPIKNYRNDAIFNISNYEYNNIPSNILHELYISEFISLTPKLQFFPNKERLFKLNDEALNKLYKCANPLEPSYDFIRQFVEHYHRCVGKIYKDINRNNSLDNVTLKSNTKRSISSNEFSETIVQGDILINQPAPFLDGKVQSSAINPATSVAFFNITTWTNGIIPYDLDSSLEAHTCLIENAMLQIMLNTCIRFRPRNDSDNFYVRIFQDPRHSCYANIGMDLQNNVTKVSLPNGCLDIGTVVHELMHVIGFYHHQNRQDRDQHLKIRFKNIKPKMRRNFKLNDPLVEQIFTPWDYDSVMLYGAKFFSKDNRSITMEPTVPDVILKDVYDKPGLSRLDALSISQLYNCPNDVRVPGPILCVMRKLTFYSDLSLLKLMLKLVESCSSNNSSSPENVKSYQYIYK